MDEKSRLLIDKVEDEYEKLLCVVEDSLSPREIIDNAFRYAFMYKAMEAVKLLAINDSFSDAETNTMLGLNSLLESLYTEKSLDVENDMARLVHTSIEDAARENVESDKEANVPLDYLQNEKGLKGRIEDNMEEFQSSLLKMEAEDIIEWAFQISAMSEAYVYLLRYHQFDKSDVDFLLKYENPLLVFADALDSVSVDSGVMHEDNLVRLRGVMNYLKSDEAKDYLRISTYKKVGSGSQIKEKEYSSENEQKQKTGGSINDRLRALQKSVKEHADAGDNSESRSIDRSL